MQDCLGHCLLLFVPLVSRTLHNSAWQPWQQPCAQSRREAAAVLCMPLTDSLSTSMPLTNSLSTRAWTQQMGRSTALHGIAAIAAGMCSGCKRCICCVQQLHSGPPCCWQLPPPEPQHTGRPPASAECCQGASWAADRRCWVLHMQGMAQSLCRGSPDAVYGCAGCAFCIKPHKTARCHCAKTAKSESWLPWLCLLH